MSDTSADSAPTPTDHLLELQRLDTEIDQLEHRRAHLPEGEAADAAAGAVVEWEAGRDRLSARVASLGDEIVVAEERSAELGADKTRLEAQLKTVIAPREAEALMHEIETIDAQRDEIETKELEALEEQAETEQLLAAHAEQEPGLRATAAETSDVAAAATRSIDEDVATLTAKRDTVRTSVGATELGRYDRLRSHHPIAVAQLVGRRCNGCHLDLSAAEVDDVKGEAASSKGIAACPQCGQMLVV